MTDSVSRPPSPRGDPDGSDAFAVGGALAAFAAHGGDLSGAMRMFPAAPRPWLDLSTGLNPVPYPVPDLPATAWTRLPDPAAQAALEAVAATVYGAAPHCSALAGPGTQALIQALALTHVAGFGAGRPRVRVLGRTYAGHAAAWNAAGAVVTTVDDPDGLVDGDVAVVVNPNNPDGRLVPAPCLRDVAGRLARRGGLLVVDEAFMDVLPPCNSLLPGGVPAGAVVLRSFGKMYGLGGVRLGFLFGDPARIAAVRVALGDWAVSGPALAIGQVARADQAWRRDAIARLHRDASRLDVALRQSGFAVLGGTPLFRLVSHDMAPRVFRMLAEAGILVRPFRDRPWLRLSPPGTESELRRVNSTLSCVAVNLC